MAIPQTVANRVAGGLQAAHVPSQFSSQRRRSGWCPAAPPAPSPGRPQRPQRRGAVQVSNFAVLQRLGLKKPAWLPDFGQAKRKAILERFFSQPISREVYEELVDDHFKMSEQLRDGAGPHTHCYFKQDWIDTMCNSVAPAIPDFTWSAATDGAASSDGYAIVSVKVSGHHTGAPFALPGLPPVPASGRRVTLEQQLMKVKVEGGRIREIVVLPSEGAGPLALYNALGGEAAAREGRIPA